MQDTSIRKKIPLIFFNSLTKKKEAFSPVIKGKKVLMYTCGPTVYGPVHIGNLRGFVFHDVLARTLALFGFRPDRIINITDVGHLVADADSGEDKMSVGAKRENKSPEEIAKKYTDLFLRDISLLNLNLNTIRFPRASAYIKEQIAHITLLEKKGFTYTTEHGVYFDISKYKDYGELGNIRDSLLKVGARVSPSLEKRNPEDFALWRFAKPNDLQQWDSPWGKGNPGWHIECSAMIHALLGKTIDIHTGGEDLAHTHHNNEIAQSSCAHDGIPLARFFMHGAFLSVGGEKISKSLGNDITLEKIMGEGFHPLALRLLFLQAHYRAPLAFTFEALSAAQSALTRLWRESVLIKRQSFGIRFKSDLREKIMRSLADDLSTPEALATLFNALQDGTYSSFELWDALCFADSVFGIALTSPPKSFLPISIKELPSSIHALALKREEARKEKNFALSDSLRKEIETCGYGVEDTQKGPLFTKKQMG